jgi:selenocysteine lyase/cysteine desulfurase
LRAGAARVAAWLGARAQDWALVENATAGLDALIASLTIEPGDELLYPLAISHYLGQGFAAEFDYCGTRDNSAWLAMPAALDYLEGFGAAAVRRHNDKVDSSLRPDLQRDRRLPAACRARADPRRAVIRVQCNVAAAAPDRSLTRERPEC